MSKRVELRVPDWWYDRVMGYARNQTRTIQNMLIHAMDQHMRRYPQNPKTGARARRTPKGYDSTPLGVEVTGAHLPVPANGIRGEGEEVQDA